jgi:hypothetical protein
VALTTKVFGGVPGESDFGGSRQSCLDNKDDEGELDQQERLKNSAFNFVKI